MNSELELLASRLHEARPEEIFGTEPEAVFRRLAKVAHPDRNEPSDRGLAEATFKRLTELFNEATRRRGTGLYGTSERLVTVRTKDRVYEVGRQLYSGDKSTIFSCDDGLFKVTRSPVDNDLLTQEAQALRTLNEGDHEQFRNYVPGLVDSFTFKEAGTAVNRRVNVLSVPDGLFSLEEVRTAYQRGVDPHHVAWIWRRLLVALGFAHRNGLVHGAVLPSHVLIHPDQRGLVLIDWAYSSTGEPIKAISSSYRAWYPSEVLEKRTPTAATDLYTAARCMSYLLEGADTPPTIRSFFAGTALERQSTRPQDAWALKDEFDAVIDRLWKREYRPLPMPARVYNASASV